MRRASLTLTILGALLCAAAVPAAIAKPAKGPDGASFYEPAQGKKPSRHGSLLRYRTTSPTLPGAPANDAWNVVYRSRDARGKADEVAGTTFVPTAPWSGKGARPVVTFAVGTQGLDESCAPSRQFDAGSEYESANIAAALDQGWAVAVTDYAGYLDGQTPDYTAGHSEGHAVLDIVRASRRLPGAGLGRKDPIAIWGYSQGGQAAAWAGRQESHYARELRVRGVAAGGVPANLHEVGESLDGGAGAGLLLASTVGLDQAYPKDFRLHKLLNAKGRKAAEAVKHQCVGETVARYAGKTISDYSKGGKSFDQLAARKGIKRILRRNMLGRRKPKVPVLQYHSSNDEIVPLPQAEALRATYCRKGVRELFEIFPGEHLTGDVAGQRDAISWIGDRFAGAKAPTNCGDPVSPVPLPSS